MDMTAFQDAPTILAMAASAAIVGLGKGGLAGLGVLAMPVLILVLPPLQAAAILLPVLCVSDIVSLAAWWRSWSLRTLALMLPGAMIGIGTGWATAALVPEPAVRLIVGVVAVAFVARWLWLRRGGRAVAARAHSVPRATFWGAMTGYTSFVAHAGGPPFQVYTLPLKLDPRILTGTSVAFFAIVNYVKLVPYFLLGQFDATNLAASAALLPVAVLATLAGAWIIRRMRAELFYPLVYAMTAAMGLKLVWDGFHGL